MRRAARLGRMVKIGLEPLFQWRRSPSEQVIAVRQGIIEPVSRYLGTNLRSTVPLTMLENPAYILFTPNTEADGQRLDIVKGDMFVRLKYYDGEDTDAETAIEACRHVFTVHSYESEFNHTFRVLGELEP